MVQKKLVFHFYLNEGWENNYANKIHFKCLAHYSRIFSEALIVIAVDGRNRHLVEPAKKAFVDCIKCDILTFKVVDNDPYFEGGTFKREVVDKLSVTPGLVFFGHNKGVSCLSTHGEFDPDSLKVWICAMYFYNLEFMDDVERKLCVDTVRTVYGTFLEYDESIQNESHTWFSGTFYWINPGRTHKWATHIPELFDREYAEWFPGEVFGPDITYFLASRCEYILKTSNLYLNARDEEYIIGKNDDDRKKFSEFLDCIDVNG